MQEGKVPTAGATVWVQTADGALIAKVMTDASGSVTADGVVPGSAVTVLAGARLRTILDVQPDDDLLVVTPPDGPGTQVPVTVRASTQDAVYRYLVTASCGGAELEDTSTGTLYVNGCTTADVLVDVQDDNYTSLEFAYAPAQNVSAALDLTALAYTPTALTSYSITGAPAEWHDVHLYRNLSNAKGPLGECDSFGADLRCPVVPGATVVDRVTAYDDTVWHESYFPTTSAGTSIALAGLPIGTIPDAPTLDLATSTVHWTGGAGANSALIEISEGDGTWQIYGPAPADGTFAFPRLPAELESFTPAAAVHVMLLNVVGGYVKVRQRVFSTDTQGLTALTGGRVITAGYEGGF